MPNPHSADQQDKFKAPNAQCRIEVQRRDLPPHCPLPSASLWDSHPKVYIPIEESQDGHM
ncbi:MAG: zinc-finger domain-containing protein, partial [Pseudomonadota bacterium]|nr:zinc-finger domain-containing protein [Pseudomonadota bacterium]